MIRTARPDRCGLVKCPGPPHILRLRRPVQIDRSQLDTSHLHGQTSYLPDRDGQYAYQTQLITLLHHLRSVEALRHSCSNGQSMTAKSGGHHQKEV